MQAIKAAAASGQVQQAILSDANSVFIDEILAVHQLQVFCHTNSPTHLPRALVARNVCIPCRACFMPESDYFLGLYRCYRLMNSALRMSFMRCLKNLLATLAPDWQGCIMEVHTNHAAFEGGVLGIAPCHVDHGCELICPDNMCKGKARRSPCCCVAITAACSRVVPHSFLSIISPAIINTLRMI